jgi:hypothetical protein
MSDYDNTNTAAIFSVDEDTKLVGSGKWNDNGFDRRIILIKQTYPDGEEHRELYAKVGRLYRNDSTSENAPTFTGPISTDRGGMRIACWEKETSQGRVLSMKIQEKKQPNPRGAVEETANFVDDKDDDVIPF